jgi:hypothetical protein
MSQVRYVSWCKFETDCIAFLESSDCAKFFPATPYFCTNFWRIPNEDESLDDIKMLVT